MRTVASKVMLRACLQRSDKVRYDDVEVGNELNLRILENKLVMISSILGAIWTEEDGQQIFQMFQLRHDMGGLDTGEQGENLKFIILLRVTSTTHTRPNLNPSSSSHILEPLFHALGNPSSVFLCARRAQIISSLKIISKDGTKRVTHSLGCRFRCFWILLLDEIDL